MFSFGWLRESRQLIGSLRDVTEGTPPASGGRLVFRERGDPWSSLSEFLPHSFRFSGFLQEFDEVFVVLLYYRPDVIVMGASKRD